MYRLIPVDQEGAAGTTTICVFQRILGSHTGELSSQVLSVLSGAQEYEPLPVLIP